jgi:hypothetical protein
MKTKTIIPTIFPAFLIIFFPLILSAQTILVPKGATWRYLDDGSDQGQAWRVPSFNDGGWPSGPAELGYGDGGEATTNSFGHNSTTKYITYYYRHSFDVLDASLFSNLVVSLRRDDGAVVYLNNHEVFRSNLPAGEINYLTLASAAAGDDGTVYIEKAIDPSLLVYGINLLAVEIHQSTADSSDISFDLQLTANVPPFKATMNFWPTWRGGNNHYYEAVASGSINWNNASAGATNRNAYLATITSEAENHKVFSLIHDNPLFATNYGSGFYGPWLGGYRRPVLIDPWSWVTGESFEYLHWIPGAPSANSSENRIAFFGNSGPLTGDWKDVNNADVHPPGYIVEYEMNLAPAPIVEFRFNEIGSQAPSTGADSTPMTFINGASAEADLHSDDRDGVSGLQGDHAFDNSSSTAMGSSGSGGYANQADDDNLDDLLSLTLQGWFKADSGSINSLARIITKQAGANSFLLIGSSSGKFQFEINNANCTTAEAWYPETGQWIFFAVTYDGSSIVNNVKFFKATRTTPVTLVETRTLNQGRALANNSAMQIGNWASLTRPFDGWLDNLRVFGSKTNQTGVLTLPQLEWLRNKDILNSSDDILLSIHNTNGVLLISWPLYPGGFQLQSAFPDPGLSGFWKPIAGVPVMTNQTYTVTSDIVDVPLFFRLIKP